ncbi:DUF4843 domain-containing protein [Chitinophaga oryzae]|uniref:DUF4843 domain-containing protein n=1 Tax=Chitinophaga oryzae TaxID=2725414 RepID=A0AAE6ZGQ5_9BACT|nr:DUF4843 domain-containing protein [Chitinophaga oryzae]QJB31897.1 DUF4843 domain-containing protein [Chitinophaga oryzae]
MKTSCLYIFLLALGSSCTKEKLLRYEGGNNIYMYIQGLGPFVSDTSQIDFSRKVSQDSTLALAFNVVGQVAAVNRTFKLVVSDSSTAVADRDFILPPADSCYIPANETHTYLPLKILRSAALYEQSFRLILKLQPNENFATSVPVYTPPQQEPRSGIVLRITIADILQQPDIWSNNIHVLGIYTRKKITLMVKQLSLDLNRFYSSPYSAAQLKNFSLEFQSYLDQQKAADNIIREEDGTVMVMGPDVQ